MLTTNRMLAHFDPWGMWNQLNSDFNSDLGEFFNAPKRTVTAPVNLWAKDDQVVVQAEVLGREPGDIDVSVHRDILTIDIKPHVQDEPENGNQIGRQERWLGGVTRQIRLPFEVDAEHVEAVCEKGLLRVTLNRHESTLPSKIEVKAR